MQSKTVIMKFGGSSVERFSAMQRVAEIVKINQVENTLVVTSALGGITDTLIALYNAARQENQSEVDKKLNYIKQRHLDLLKDAQLEKSEAAAVSEKLNQFLGELGNAVSAESLKNKLPLEAKDQIVAFGELMSSTLLAAIFRKNGINSAWFDVRDILRTEGEHGKAIPLMWEIEHLSQQHLRPLLEAGKVPVLQGFIGRDASGSTTTLGRGGSDYSAALIGAALNVDDIQIWTDVDGVLSTDPRVVSDAHKVDVLTFAEAAELAYFGAKVLHPATILPAMQKGIPVFVRNTRRPEGPGTRIKKDYDATANGQIVKSIAFKRHIHIINIKSERMLMAHGFLKAVFTIFDKYKTSVDLVSTSEVNVSVTIDTTDHLEEICAELGELGDVEVLRDQALICLVGSGLRNHPGIAARAFTAILPANIRMISQGASEINLSFLIEGSDLDAVVQKLHDAFFDLKEAA